MAVMHRALSGLLALTLAAPALPACHLRPPAESPLAMQVRREAAEADAMHRAAAIAVERATERRDAAELALESAKAGPELTRREHELVVATEALHRATTRRDLARDNSENLTAQAASLEAAHDRRVSEWEDEREDRRESRQDQAATPLIVTGSLLKLAGGTASSVASRGEEALKDIKSGKTTFDSPAAKADKVRRLNTLVTNSLIAAIPMLIVGAVMIAVGRQCKKNGGARRTTMTQGGLTIRF